MSTVAYTGIQHGRVLHADTRQQRPADLQITGNSHWLKQPIYGQPAYSRLYGRPVYS